MSNNQTAPAQDRQGAAMKGKRGKTSESLPAPLMEISATPASSTWVTSPW